MLPIFPRKNLNCKLFKYVNIFPFDDSHSLGFGCILGYSQMSINKARGFRTKLQLDTEIQRFRLKLQLDTEIHRGVRTKLQLDTEIHGGLEQNSS